MRNDGPQKQVRNTRLYRPKSSNRHSLGRKCCHGEEEVASRSWVALE